MNASSTGLTSIRLVGCQVGSAVLEVWQLHLNCWAKTILDTWTFDDFKAAETLFKNDCPLAPDELLMHLLHIKSQESFLFCLALRMLLHDKVISWGECTLCTCVWSRLSNFILLIQEMQLACVFQDSVLYNIVGGTEANDYFYISPSNGIIYLKNQLSRNVRNQYVVSRGIWLSKSSFLNVRLLLF